MSSSLEVLTSWSGIFAKLTRYSSSQNNEKSQLLLNHRLQEPLMSSVMKVLCPFLCIISSISHRWTWLNATFAVLNTPLGWDIPLPGIAVSLSGSEWVTDCVLWPNLLVLNCFSAHPMSPKHNTFLTSGGDLRACLEYSFCVSRSLLSCRSKGQADRKLQEQTTTAAQLYSKALQGITVRLKANNVPTAHVHILCGSAAFPQALAIFQSGKGVSYTRAGSLLCGAVIHLRLHEQFDS